MAGEESMFLQSNYLRRKESLAKELRLKQIDEKLRESSKKKK